MRSWSIGRLRFALISSRFAGEMRGTVRTLVPFAPDSNLVCLALNPAGNRDVAVANAFVRRLHDELRCDTSRPLQDKQFFGSVTTLRPEALGEAETRRILDALGLDAATLGGDGNDRIWGGWGPLRGRLVPGTAIFVAALR